MRRHIVATKAATFAQNQSRYQTGDPGIDVHHCATGEIKHGTVFAEHMKFAQEATTPNPVTNRSIDKQGPQGHE